MRKNYAINVITSNTYDKDNDTNITTNKLLNSDLDQE